MAQIKMTTGEMRAMAESMGLLTNNQETGRPLSLPFKVSYWASRIVMKLQKEYEVSEKVRTALAEQHGTKSEDGTRIEFKGESGKNFAAEFTEILNTEIEMDLPQIKMEQFEGLVLPAAVFSVYDKLIVAEAA